MRWRGLLMTAMLMLMLMAWRRMCARCAWILWQGVRINPLCFVLGVKTVLFEHCRDVGFLCRVVIEALFVSKRAVGGVDG